MFPTPSSPCVQCGRNFQSAGALTKHEKICQRGTKRLADALQRAKEVFQRKKRRTSSSVPDPLHSSSHETNDCSDVNNNPAVEGDSRQDIVVQPVSIVSLLMIR